MRKRMKRKKRGGPVASIKRSLPLTDLTDLTADKQIPSDLAAEGKVKYQEFVFVLTIHSTIHLVIFPFISALSLSFTFLSLSLHLPLSQIIFSEIWKVGCFCLVLLIPVICFLPYILYNATEFNFFHVTCSNSESLMSDTKILREIGTA